MLVTVIAVLCSLTGEVCREQVITDQAKDLECVYKSQESVADWMMQHPQYSHGWRVAQIKCIRVIRKDSAA
ncbi:MULTISPECIES: hypothetical protein [unclassified Bradyrhizobium]|uniref:hypothetical protein n=1 Tax=unclassified Bradyrhizobium TaxID=2631580 RepID=UPI0028E872C6|nr:MULTISPECIES: hypothetical protein [unclassified Bradyrhizobium]